MTIGGKLLLATTWGIFLFAAALPFAPGGSSDLFADDVGFDFPRPEYLIESLRHPRKLSGWNREGLLTEKGEVIHLPSVEALPERSPILDEIVHRSIEVDPESGRVHGLLPIWHGCGNDPVALHLARVDVARVLEYVLSEPECESLDENGWPDRCFYFYEQWLSAAGLPR